MCSSLLAATAAACSSPTPNLAALPGAGDGGRSGAPSDRVPANCFDVPARLKADCGSFVCHGSGAASAGLDLEAPGVEERVSLAAATMCAGTLADPSDPRGSVLYSKLTATPCGGSPMPLGGPLYSDEERDCIEAWISGLLPPPPPPLEDDDPGAGGGPPQICEPGTREPCYSGEALTLNVGICSAGERTCSADGSAWSGCEGEITPRPENCLTQDIDENCDGVSQTVCQDEWSRAFATEENQSVRAVATDSQGSVYVFGEWMGVMDFGFGPVQATMEAPSEETGEPQRKRDAFLAKYDQYGNPLWFATFGQTGSQYAGGLAVDSEDNVIAVGRAFGTIALGGQVLTIGGGNSDVFVVKLSADGRELWSKKFGDNNPDRAERVAVDNAGDVLIAGTFSEDLDINDFGIPTPHADVDDLNDVFVMKLQGDSGDVQWVRQMGGGGEDYGAGVAADADGNVIVGGSFSETAVFGTTLLTSAGGQDAFLAKFSPSGELLWAHGYGGSGDDRVGDLAAERAGDDCGDAGACEIVVHGYFSSQIDFGDRAWASAGGRDLIVAKVDKEGRGVWSLAVGDEQDQLDTSFEVWPGVAMDADGNTYLTGAFSGNVTFDPFVTFRGDGKTDFYLVKLDPDGRYIVGHAFGQPGTEFTLDVAVDPTEHVVIGGRNFGNSMISLSNAGYIQGQGSSNGFVARFDMSH